jgi:hypothetical protein
LIPYRWSGHVIVAPQDLDRRRFNDDFLI